MPFTLSITFTGLVLFATDATNPDQKKFHAIFLKSQMPGMQMEAHLPRLMYDLGYEHGVLTNTLACRQLDNGRLPITEGTMPIDFNSVPPELAGVAPFFQIGTLNRQYVNENASQIAVALVTMSTGLATTHGAGAPFNVASNGQPVWSGQLTNWIRWSVAGISTTDANGNECYNLNLGALGQGAAPTCPPLYPIDNAIELVMANGRACDLVQGPAQNIASGTVVDHFPVYREVLGGQTPITVTLAVGGTYPDDSVIAHKTGGCTATSPCPQDAAQANVSSESTVARNVLTPWNSTTIHTVTCITALAAIS